MNADKQNLIAYLATLAGIVLLAIVAALICLFFKGSEAQLAKVIAALAFLSATITGLIGVIGTFRPKGSPVAATDTGDINVKAAT